MNNVLYMNYNTASKAAATAPVIATGITCSKCYSILSGKAFLYVSFSEYTAPLTFSLIWTGSTVTSIGLALSNPNPNNFGGTKTVSNFIAPSATQVPFFSIPGK